MLPNAKALAFGSIKDFASAYPTEYNKLLQDNGLTEANETAIQNFSGKVYWVKSAIKYIYEKVDFINPLLAHACRVCI